MNMTTDIPEGEGAPTEGAANGRSTRPKLLPWILVLLALQAAAIIGLGAALIASSNENLSAIEELRDVVDGLPKHDPQAELEQGDLLCATRDGDVSYRPGLGGVFVHECRYRDAVTRRTRCEAHDIYGNSWSCNDR